MRRVRSSDATIRALEDNVADAMGARETALTDGVVFADANGAPLQLLAGQVNRIAHGFGRPVRWMLVSPQAESTVWEDPTDAVLPADYLTLRCSFDVKTYLFLFPA